ncbi:uncharacterized protein Tco025E_06591 [Trypanosoma conorhini]|uniref:Uncharacterized protein n=1 Tax=Trypanosoma conorhini TaxID=83891 RepID=A0A422P1S5_9TRYP|nr:uncharacterized protein Tco025E_06591 [Trypanosoma conorhini]RNF11657.1 hypothetical protein Tco025E_06591 [Trypanosoma conorhini]
MRLKENTRRNLPLLQPLLRKRDPLLTPEKPPASTERSAEQDPDSILRLRKAGETATGKPAARETSSRVGACGLLGWKSTAFPPGLLNTAPPKARPPPAQAEVKPKWVIGGSGWPLLKALNSLAPRRFLGKTGALPPDKNTGPSWVGVGQSVWAGLLCGAAQLVGWL